MFTLLSTILVLFIPFGQCSLSNQGGISERMDHDLVRIFEVPDTPYNFHFGRMEISIPHPNGKSYTEDFGQLLLNFSGSDQFQMLVPVSYGPHQFQVKVAEDRDPPAWNRHNGYWHDIGALVRHRLDTMLDGFGNFDASILTLVDVVSQKLLDTCGPTMIDMVNGESQFNGSRKEQTPMELKILTENGDPFCSSATNENDRVKIENWQEEQCSACLSGFHSKFRPRYKIPHLPRATAMKDHEKSYPENLGSVVVEYKGVHFNVTLDLPSDTFPGFCYPCGLCGEEASIIIERALEERCLGTLEDMIPGPPLSPSLARCFEATQPVFWFSFGADGFPQCEFDTTIKRFDESPDVHRPSVADVERILSELGRFEGYRFVPQINVRLESRLAPDIDRVVYRNQTLLYRHYQPGFNIAQDLRVLTLLLDGQDKSSSRYVVPKLVAFVRDPKGQVVGQLFENIDTATALCGECLYHCSASTRWSILETLMDASDMIRLEDVSNRRMPYWRMLRGMNGEKFILGLDTDFEGSPFSEWTKPFSGDRVTEGAMNGWFCGIEGFSECE